MSDLGIVVIGRNEGERLVRCMASIGTAASVVYVDSGSTDGSVAAATAAGARVVKLDLSIPFTAARARNAGRAALGTDARYIQFIDGDCALQPGWLGAACHALDTDTTLAAVFGRRREISPEASIYNWLCDQEWAVRPGPVRQFGGDVLLRATALDQAGGYPEEMIAGEEPDLSMRLGARGWKIACLPVEMTRHDAAITSFSQWWRRVERSGHAYAELDRRHPGVFRRSVRGALIWGAIIPLGAMVAIALGAATGVRGLTMAGCALLALIVLQFVRITLRERRARPMREALRWSLFLLLDKPPHAIGIARYWSSRIRGRRTTLIEYKGRAA